MDCQQRVPYVTATAKSCAASVFTQAFPHLGICTTEQPPTKQHKHAPRTAHTCQQNSTTTTSVLLIASQPSRNILQSALHRCQLSRQSRQSLQCARVSGVVGKHAYNASQHAYLILGTEVGIQPVHGISISHICWPCPRTTAATPASTAQAPTITV